MPCVCEPASVNGHEYSQFIGTFFGECAYEWNEYLSVLLGYMSLCIWIFACLPQIIQNFQTKQVEGISMIFLLCWFAGDVTNLLGVLWTHQLMSQIAVSAWWLGSDIVLVLQQLWYQAPVSEEAIDMSEEYTALLSEQERRNDWEGKYGANSKTFGKKVYSAVPIAIWATIGVLLHFRAWSDGVDMRQSRVLLGSEPLCDAGATVNEDQIIIGAVCGYISALFFIGSRVPQIWKNYQRESVEDLSKELWMETTFGFVFGSLGVLCFDVVIFYQFYLWEHKLDKKHVK